MVRWYVFTAVKDGREVLENIPARSIEYAVSVLHKLGYTDLRLIYFYFILDYSETSELI